MIDERQAKRSVVQAGKKLFQAGLIARTWGNVSCRLDEEHFLITASGRDYRKLTEEEVVSVKLEDLNFEGSVKPSSEKRIHRAVYRLKKEIRFVIHTHQDNASAVSAMGMDAVTFDEERPSIGRTVPCAKYGLPGTKKLCEHTARALERSEGNAVILQHHGALCFGKDDREAFQAAYELEEACGQYLKKLDNRILCENKGDARQQAAHVIWNRSQVLLDFAAEFREMRPYLDDFAQIAGLKMPVLPRNRQAAEAAAKAGKSVLVKGVGAFCTADTLEDAQAISMIAEKNAMAAFAAQIAGGKPLKPWECLVMRQNYLRHYAKLKDGDSEHPAAQRPSVFPKNVFRE